MRVRPMRIVRVIAGMMGVRGPLEGRRGVDTGMDMDMGREMGRGMERGVRGRGVRMRMNVYRRLRVLRRRRRYGFLLLGRRNGEMERGGITTV